MNKEIHWNIIEGFLFQESNSLKVATIKIIACQPVIEEMNESPTALAVKKQ
jgi:hypothetical protein